MFHFNFLIVLLIGFIDYLGLALVYPVFAGMLFDPAYPLVSPDSSPAVRGALLGVLIGLAPFMQFFSAPLLGALSDLKGRKKTLLYGTLVGSIAYGSAILGVCTHSIGLLFLYRVLVGVSSGTVPVAQAMISDMSTEETKAGRFSLFSASLGLGFTVGPFLGGKLADPAFVSWGGYAVPFLAASIMCLFSLVVIAWKFPETCKKKDQTSFQLMQSIHNIQKVIVWPQLRWLFLATFAFAFGWSFFNEFVPVLLREKLKFSLSDIGNYYAYGGFWYALCSGVLTNAVLKYFPPEKLGSIALMGSALCMLSFLAMDGKQFIWWILPFLMFCLTFTYPTTAAMVSNQAGGGNQGEILGVYQSVIGLAMGLSPLLVGSAVGLFPALTAIGGAAAMFLAAFAFRKGAHALSRIVLE